MPLCRAVQPCHQPHADACENRYYCSIGSTTPTPTAGQCNLPAFFCPLGSGSPSVVPTGHYATGDVADGQTPPPMGLYSSHQPCPAGSYCIGGVRAGCPPGRYGSVGSLATEDCSGLCDAGRYVVWWRCWCGGPLCGCHSPRSCVGGCNCCCWNLCWPWRRWQPGITGTAPPLDKQPAHARARAQPVSTAQLARRLRHSRRAHRASGVTWAPRVLAAVASVSLGTTARQHRRHPRQPRHSAVPPRSTAPSPAARRPKSGLACMPSPMQRRQSQATVRRRSMPKRRAPLARTARMA